MGFFDKLFSGLTKTRVNMEDLEEIFRNYRPDDDEFFDELEELLIMADMGADTVDRVVTSMHYLCFDKNVKRGDKARELLIGELEKELDAGDNTLKLNTKPSVILMVGVNGVGKTTTIGKLAAQLKAQGKKVLLVAGDTFRAATSSSASGPSARARTSCATRRGAIPPPWSSTASAPARPAARTSSSSTPRAGSTTSRT